MTWKPETKALYERNLSRDGLQLIGQLGNKNIGVVKLKCGHQKAIQSTDFSKWTPGRKVRCHQCLLDEDWGDLLTTMEKVT